MSRYVALMIDGKYTVHAPEANGNYATLCGVADDDRPDIGGTPTPLQIGSRITCRTCIAIIKLAKRYRERDFAEEKLLT